MARMMAALIGGVLLGILVMLAADRFGPSSNQAPDVIIRDIADVPTYLALLILTMFK